MNCFALTSTIQKVSNSVYLSVSVSREEGSWWCWGRWAGLHACSICRGGEAWRDDAVRFLRLSRESDRPRQWEDTHTHRSYILSLLIPALLRARQRSLTTTSSISSIQLEPPATESMKARPPSPHRGDPVGLDGWQSICRWHIARLATACVVNRCLHLVSLWFLIVLTRREAFPKQLCCRNQ